jgi:AcrR family transcriptional regulator
MKLKTIHQRKNAATARPSSGNGGPRSTKGAARREQILNDLMHALAAGRLRNPSLREIGQALATEPAHILYYFGSREALLQAVILRWDSESRALVGKEDPALPLTLADFVEAIAHNINRPGIVHLYLTFAAEAVDPAHPAHAFFASRFARLQTSLAAAIRTEQANGSTDPAQNADVQARMLIALADGLQLQSLVEPALDAAADLSEALRRLRMGT